MFPYVPVGVDGERGRGNNKETGRKDGRGMGGMEEGRKEGREGGRQTYKQKQNKTPDFYAHVFVKGLMFKG